MENALKITKVESYIISLMGKFPVLSYYANTRGWSFLITWGHRLAGLTLAGYMFAHIYTLSLLFSPAGLIFHSLNGGRLILYELFHVRAEEIVIRFMIVLGLIYIFIVGFFFIEEAQQISATLFWSITVAISLITLFIVLFKVWPTGNSILWKLQRITGAFMFPMLIGHMLFMHMTYLTGHESKTILIRMQSPFIKGIDFVFIVFLLFHAGYGIFSIFADYIKPGPLLKSLAFLIIIVMAISAFFGIRIVVAL
ncbi:MAG: hypothetical protein JRI72_17460 [Deltaproteobacteria bacterium]|nr:hypothetical protein [Deltaproteobacteria bacterium]